MKLNVSKSYGKHVVFDGLQLEFDEGEIVCILGASGVGKTTLLQILARKIPFEGELLDVPNRVGYAYQEARLLPNLSVEDNLRYVGATDEEIARLLADTQLTAHAKKRPFALSGGEKQRVALCRAVVGKRELLLLDEPFSSLDTPLKRKIYEAFLRLWQGYRPTVALVTHDIEEAWALGHRTIVLREGKIVLDTRPTATALPRAFGEGVEWKRAVLRALEGDDENER